MKKKSVLISIVCFLILSVCCGCSTQEPSNSRENQEDEISFYLKSGELGDYGKTVKVDKYEYIFYYLPSGKYTAELVSGKSLSDVYAWIEKNKSKKTAEGYTEYPLVGKLSYSKKGEIVEFVIHDNEHILLVDGVTLKITPITEQE